MDNQSIQRSNYDWTDGSPVAGELARMAGELRGLWRTLPAGRRARLAAAWAVALAALWAGSLWAAA